MIGNDVVDLELANRESDWRRKGLLDKIFTKQEQRLILNSDLPESMVWILWSMKEASYKIYNRLHGVRGYIALRLECSDTEVKSSGIYGKVRFEDELFYTKTVVTKDCIDTVAVINLKDFDRIKVLSDDTEIKKVNGLPEFFDRNNDEFRPVSISHHGRYKSIVTFS